jgi:hypothetical protein
MFIGIRIQSMITGVVGTSRWLVVHAKDLITALSGVVRSCRELSGVVEGHEIECLPKVGFRACVHMICY